MRQHIEINREGMLLLDRLNDAPLYVLQDVIADTRQNRRGTRRMTQEKCIRTIVDMFHGTYAELSRLEDALMFHGLWTGAKRRGA